MSGTDSTKGGIHLLGPNGAPVAKKDVQGRVLRHNATVQDVYDIVAEETAKVHEFYMNQIPVFVATMMRDGMMEFGLIKVVEIDGQPRIVNAATGQPAASSSEGAGIGMDNTALPQSGDATAPDAHSPETTPFCRDCGTTLDGCAHINPELLKKDTTGGGPDAA